MHQKLTQNFASKFSFLQMMKKNQASLMQHDLEAKIFNRKIIEPE